MLIYWIYDFNLEGVGIQTTLRDGMPRNRCSNSGRGKDHTGSSARSTSHLAGTWSSFPGGKASEAWRWPLAYIYCRSQESVEPCHPPNIPLWRALGQVTFTFTSIVLIIGLLVKETHASKRTHACVLKYEA